jgi:hypothetical protein
MMIILTRKKMHYLTIAPTAKEILLLIDNKRLVNIDYIGGIGTVNNAQIMKFENKLVSVFSFNLGKTFNTPLKLISGIRQEIF